MTTLSKHYEHYSSVISLLLAAANIVAVSFVLVMSKLVFFGA